MHYSLGQTSGPISLCEKKRSAKYARSESAHHESLEIVNHQRTEAFAMKGIIIIKTTQVLFSGFCLHIHHVNVTWTV